MNPPSEDRAIVIAGTTAIEQAGAPSEIVRLAHVEPELARRALAIIAGRPVDQYNPPLQPARAIAAALYEQQTGQVAGRDFFVDNRMGIVPGYRGRMKEADDRGISDYLDDYRPFTAEENKDHEIKPGDIAKVCELMIPARAKACREAGIPYRPTVGYGIIRAAEKLTRDGKPLQLSGGYTWDRKARNRALKDALSHAGFAKNAREVIEDAQNEGLVLGYDAETLDKLNRDQAAYVVETAQAKQKQAYQQAEAQAAALLAQVGADEEPEEGLFTVESEPPQRPPHWTDDADLVARMFKYAEHHGMNREQTLDALGVDELHQFSGTAKAASEYIAAHIKLAQEMAAEEPA